MNTAILYHSFYADFWFISAFLFFAKQDKKELFRIPWTDPFWDDPKPKSEAAAERRARRQAAKEQEDADNALLNKCIEEIDFEAQERSRDLQEAIVKNYRDDVDQIFVKDGNKTHVMEASTVNAVKLLMARKLNLPVRAFFLHNGSKVLEEGYNIRKDSTMHVHIRGRGGALPKGTDKKNKVNNKVKKNKVSFFSVFSPRVLADHVIFSASARGSFFFFRYILRECSRILFLFHCADLTGCFVVLFPPFQNPAGKIAKEELDKVKQAFSTTPQVDALLLKKAIHEVCEAEGMDPEVFMRLMKSIREKKGGALAIGKKPAVKVQPVDSVGKTVQQVLDAIKGNVKREIIFNKVVLSINANLFQVYAHTMKMYGMSKQLGLNARVLQAYVFFKYKQQTGASNSEIANQFKTTETEVNTALREIALFRRAPMLYILDYHPDRHGKNWFAKNHRTLMQVVGRLSAEDQQVLMQDNGMITIPTVLALPAPAPPVPAAHGGGPAEEEEGPYNMQEVKAALGSKAQNNEEQPAPPPAASSKKLFAVRKFDISKTKMVTAEDDPLFTIRSNNGREQIVAWLHHRPLRVLLNAVPHGDKILANFRLLFNGKDLDLDTPIGDQFPAGSVIDAVVRQRGGAGDEDTSSDEFSDAYNDEVQVALEEDIGSGQDVMELPDDVFEAALIRAHLRVDARRERQQQNLAPLSSDEGGGKMMQSQSHRLQQFPQLRQRQLLKSLAVMVEMTVLATRLNTTMMPSSRCL